MKNTYAINFRFRCLVPVVMLFFLMAANALFAQQIFYNWSSDNLPVYKQPSLASVKVGSLKIGQKVVVDKNATNTAMVVYVGNFGDTSKVWNDGMYGDDQKQQSWIYKLKLPWVKLSGASVNGYVPLGFLSSLPYKKYQTATNSDASFVGYLNGFFGSPVSSKKEELEKDSSIEIHKVVRYNYKNGARYSFEEYYVELDGAGGDTHTIFIPGINLHEAMLLMLNITKMDFDVAPEAKRANRIRSNYDYFSWLYNSSTKDDEGNNIDLNKSFRFYYYQEGGSSQLDFNLKDGGVEIVYSYGGC